MLSTVDLIDRARHAQGDVSDYRVAQLLDLKPSQISAYRHRRICPSDPVAARLGELAGVHPLEAVFGAHLERATTPEEREIWLNALALLPTRKQAS